MWNRIARPVRSSAAAYSSLSKPPPGVVRPPPNIQDVSSPLNAAAVEESAASSASNTSFAARNVTKSVRKVPLDGRERLNRSWISINQPKDEDSHGKMVRAGFVYQSASGVFQLLPLGLRVQDKISHIIDRHMRRFGASRLQLSALSQESLWLQSGRLDKIGSELFRFQDRRKSKFLLSPTHEEEITSLVRARLRFANQFPLRLYQITQKYRDELRPRQGLLRTRDFLMKDLYTFDYDVNSALDTYEEVRAAYARIFIDELRLPMLIAQASSGDMGGDLSHEYHFPTDLGEDHVMSCNHCDYVANEEVAESCPQVNSEHIPAKDRKFQVWRGISKCRTTLVNVWFDSSYSQQDEFITNAAKDAINTYAVKKVFPDLDSGVDEPGIFFQQLGESTNFKVINLFDLTISEEARSSIQASENILPKSLSSSTISGNFSVTSDDNHDNSFLRVRQGDRCPQCSTGTLNVTKAIELGHTFHLGTRYSLPLNAFVYPPPEESLPRGGKSAAVAANTGESTKTATTLHNSTTGDSRRTFLQMGCHGIGISRLIGAIAQHVAGPSGLSWPRAIAPYEVVIVARTPAIPSSVVESLYDKLVSKSVDAVLDDPCTGSLGPRFNSYNLVGIPVFVVFGINKANETTVRIMCPRIGVDQHNVPETEVVSRVEKLLGEL